MSIFVSIIQQSQFAVYGLWGRSSNKTVARDIPALSKKYCDIVGKPSASVLPFFVLSKDYDETAGQFDLLIGADIEDSRLQMFCIPDGIYGKVTVRPKFGLLWGAAIGEAKRQFYTQWLPTSKYTAQNMEYELHTEKSVMKKPEVDLFFALRRK